MTTMSVPEPVLAGYQRAGAAFLDATHPDWRVQVVRADLCMNRGDYSGMGDCGCVVSQLDHYWLIEHAPEDDAVGEFVAGLIRLSGLAEPRQRDRWAIEHGFLAPAWRFMADDPLDFNHDDDHERVEQEAAEYAALDRLWQAELDRQVVG